VPERHKLRCCQIDSNNIIDAGQVFSAPRRVWSTVSRTTPRVRQEAAQCVHALHERETTARYRRMHAQRIGRNQSDSRQKGFDRRSAFLQNQNTIFTNNFRIKNMIILRLNMIATG